MKKRELTKKNICIFLTVAAILLTACTSKEKKTFDSLASFEGTTVCHMTGTNFDSLIKPVIPNVTFKNFNTLTDLAAAVQGGKVDALSIDVPVAQLLVARNQELMVFPEVVTEDRYGFAVLLSAQKRMNKQGKMVVRNVNEIVREVFEVTGLNDILTIE